LSSVPTWRPDGLLAPLRRAAGSAVWRLTLAFAAPLALGAGLFVAATYVLMVTEDAKATKEAVNLDVGIMAREAGGWNALTGWAQDRLLAQRESQSQGQLTQTYYRLDVAAPGAAPAQLMGDAGYAAPQAIDCGLWLGWGPCVREAKAGADERWFYLRREGSPAVAGLARRIDISRLAGAPAYLYVGRLSSMADIEARMLRLAAWMLGVAALGAVGVGFLVSRRIVRQVEALNALCDRVRQGELAARASEAGGDEFSELARHINTMLEQIASLVVGLQDVSNRIAHDLRTPLARLQTDLKRAAELAENEAGRAAVEAAAVETETILATFQALLDITEAEAGADAGLQPLDLADTARAAAELYEAVADDAGVRLVLDAAPARILGEPSLLVRLVANLVDNAIKFSPPGGVVRLAVGREEGAAWLRVSDQGPGVPPAEREQVFKRFVRGAATRSTPGHGLGLPLVAAITKRHGARIRLDDAAPGLSVTVAFRAM
jgi:signal transduction histidine kinase